MIVRNVIEIQAQTYVEEQFLLHRFPGVVWVSGVRGEFATFYVPESKKTLVEKYLNEWKTQNS